MMEDEQASLQAELGALFGTGQGQRQATMVIPDAIAIVGL